MQRWNRNVCLVDNFHKQFDLPQVFGCVDGTHIPIKQPTENSHDFFCYKMKYTLLFAKCCHRNKFSTKNFKMSNTQWQKVNLARQQTLAYLLSFAKLTIICIN